MLESFEFKLTATRIDKGSRTFQQVWIQFWVQWHEEDKRSMILEIQTHIPGGEWSLNFVFTFGWLFLHLFRKDTVLFAKIIQFPEVAKDLSGRILVSVIPIGEISVFSPPSNFIDKHWMMLNCIEPRKMFNVHNKSSNYFDPDGDSCLVSPLNQLVLIPFAREKVS